MALRLLLAPRGTAYYGVARAPPARATGKGRKFTEARAAAVRAGVVAKPSPLGDERGSVREIGLWSRMCPTPHFLELSRTAR